MKKSLLLSCFALVFSACQEPEVVSPVPPPEKVNISEPISLVSRLLLPGDPNLDPNWNWEESGWSVYFLNGEHQVSSELDYVNPFYNDQIYGNGDPSKLDMRAADGWMLVARDLGTPTQAPRVPYVVLYNRFRGLLRVCALRTVDLPTSYQTTTLSLADTTIDSPLIRFSGSAEQLTVTESGPLEWMVSEFNVQGYSEAISRQAQFTISFREAVMYLSSLSDQPDINNIAQPHLSLESFEASSKTYSIASYSSRLWDGLPRIGNAEFRTAVSASNLTEQDPQTLTNAAGGYITSFASAGSVPNYSVSLNRSKPVWGTLDAEVYLGSITLYLRPDAAHYGEPHALQPIPWGVMNYTAPVSLYVEKATNCGGQDGCGKDQFTTRAGFFDDILLINPAVADEVTNVEAGWIFAGEGRVAFDTLRKFKSDGFNQGRAMSQPIGVGVRLTFRNGDVVYNRIPLQFL